MLFKKITDKYCEPVQMIIAGIYFYIQYLFQIWYLQLFITTVTSLLTNNIYNNNWAVILLILSHKSYLNFTNLIIWQIKLDFFSQRGQIFCNLFI